jgi:hypothetical protein
MLADAMAAGQGPAVTAEETHAITNGRQLLTLLLGSFDDIFSRPSSDADTESDSFLIFF